MEIIIKEGIKNIRHNAFNGCTAMTAITIPNSVENIDANAFCACKGLTEIVIPSSVKSIGSYAFAFCANLKNVIIGENVETIGWDAFACCPNLTSVTFLNRNAKISNFPHLHYLPKEKLTVHGYTGSVAEKFAKEYGYTFTPLEDESELQQSTTVVELCPSCGTEIEMRWNVKTDGFKAFCPVCGNRLMLCDECMHRTGECHCDCDYDSETDSCRFNPKEKVQLTIAADNNKPALKVGDICIYCFDGSENKSKSVVEIVKILDNSRGIAEIKFHKVIVDDSGNGLFEYLLQTGKTMNAGLKYLKKIDNLNYDGKSIPCPDCGKEIVIEYDRAECSDCGWSASDAELDEIMPDGSDD